MCCCSFLFFSVFFCCTLSGLSSAATVCGDQRITLSTTFVPTNTSPVPFQYEYVIYPNNSSPYSRNAVRYVSEERQPTHVPPASTSAVSYIIRYVSFVNYSYSSTTPTTIIKRNLCYSNITSEKMAIKFHIVIDFLTTFSLRLRILDSCCGWSLPTYSRFTVNPLANVSFVAPWVNNRTFCWDGDDEITGTYALGDTAVTVPGVLYLCMCL